MRFFPFRLYLPALWRPSYRLGLISDYGEVESEWAALIGPDGQGNRATHLFHQGQVRDRPGDGAITFTLLSSFIVDIEE